MKKKYYYLLLLLIPGILFGFRYFFRDQYPYHNITRWLDNQADTSCEAIVIFSPSNDPGNRISMAKIRFDSTFRIFARDFYLTVLDSTKNAGQPTSLLWLANNGLARRTPFSSVVLPVGQVSGLSVGLSSSDFSITGSPITGSGTITANLNNSGVSAGTYDKVTVNAKGIVTAGGNPIWNDVTRTINSSTFTISSTQPARIYYVISISCTATIGSASAGSVLFQYSINGGSTWIDCGEIGNSNQVSLAIALNSVNTNRFVLSWDGIPAGALCRLVPTTSGTTTITWIRGREGLV